VNAAVRSLQYTTPVKVAFQSQRFWETTDHICGGHSWIEADITQFMYPSHGIGNAEGCVVAAFPFGGPAGDRFTALSPEQRIETTLTEGEKLHPGFGKLVRNGISRAWAKTTYSLGGFSPSAPPSILQISEGPFVFAGDYTTYLTGWMEGGVLSGQRAVRQLLGRLADDLDPAQSCLPGSVPRQVRGHVLDAAVLTDQ
jgi:monoamine oxidase